MEEISKPEARSAMYINHLKNSRIVMVPIFNPGFEAETALQSRVQALLTKYSPDYTVVARGVKRGAAQSPMAIRTSTNSYLTNWTKEKFPSVSNERVGIENYISSRYTSIVLNNHIPDACRYSHGTVKWVEAVINDMASYFKSIVV